MKLRVIVSALLAAVILGGCAAATGRKGNGAEMKKDKGYQYITDLLADPDDEQSLVRMFVTCNQVDLKGIIVSTSCWRQNQDQAGRDGLYSIIDAYGEALPNLQKHADGYPSLRYIKSISVMGQTGYSMEAVGDGMDSDGSELIISTVDSDDRPTWINLWGGANTVAQAL